MIEPLIDRFDRLDRTVIINRLAQTPHPYNIKGDESAELLAAEFMQRFKSQFIPTNQLIDMAERLRDIASAHSRTTYPSIKAYVRGSYADLSDVPLEDFVPSICISGPAGVGKSAFARAMQRVFAGETAFKVPNHSDASAVISWSMGMEPKLNPSSLTDAYLKADGCEYRGHSGDLKNFARHRLFVRAVSMLSTDETQFNSMSTSANALISSTLIRQGELGVPNVFYCNFSLVHKLMRRPQEDRQRILSRPWVMLPDASDSSCWKKTISRTCQLVPDLFSQEVKDCPENLHFWTAGSKRLLGELLRLAILESASRGEVVCASDLERAYESLDYSSNREDIQLMYQQLQTNKQASRSRPDLWCPWPIADSDRAALLKQVEATSKERFLRSAIDSSLTKEEKAIDKIQRQNMSRGKKATVTRLPVPNNSKLQSLTDAAKRFSDDS